MIENIQRLKQFGIFKDHIIKTEVKNFEKYNLFYGWNGSGKSTLSRLFHCIENKMNLAEFPSAEFTVKIKGGAVITQANVAEANLNIYTFNHDFINENISWDSLVKSILLVDKEKIIERGKLNTLKKLQKNNSEVHSREALGISTLESNVSKFESDSARNIKKSLQSIDTTDTYYLNYDKRKLKTFINRNLEATKSHDSILDAQELQELINAAKPDQKSPIPFTLNPINQEIFKEIKKGLDDLLKSSVISQTIQRLVEHGDIKSWVETGIYLHKRHEVNQCEFCGNTITDERIKQLEAHFNEAYKAFQKKLMEADDMLSKQCLQPPTALPAKSELYDEFQNFYGDAHIALDKAINDFNKEIAAWQIVLKEKISNPLETRLAVLTITELSIKAFNEAVTAISTAIRKHNHKSRNFREETKRAKEQLELHHTTNAVKTFGYHEKKKELTDRKTANSTLAITVSRRKEEISTLEDSLSNESLGADQFNKSLHDFLGRDELTLRFNPDKKGYEIRRNNAEPNEGKMNLSESEKTAIAFVYFITKLKENDNKIEDTIIVVDDPISSYDSNHLLHASSFLKTNCGQAKQLFVLTHNFTFFKHVRDWSPKKSSNIYVVSANNKSPRSATFTNAGKALTQYNSEYHYIFERLHSLANEPTLETDDYFLAANLSRKLLEAFLSFKLPRKRRNFSKLIDEAALTCKNLGEERKDKIRKFINAYSHNASIETNEDLVENLSGESVTVIKDIFTWIKELDEKHYLDMIAVVSPSHDPTLPNLG